MNRDLVIAVSQGLSPAARSRVIADTARRDIAEIAAENNRIARRPVPYETTVDGARSSRLEGVNPDRGVIVALWEVQNHVVRWIWDMLVEHSPVLSGRYRASHQIFADGEQMESPDDTREAREWVLMPSVPYARKVEHWHGVYEGVAAMAARRFGNIARISFGYRDLPGGNAAARVPARRRRQAARESRQPAIIVTPR